MKKQWEFGLAVTNPYTKDRGIIVGFKNRKQAIHLGKFRAMRGSVLNPRIVDYDVKKYYNYKAGHYIITQKEILKELKTYFEL